MTSIRGLHHENHDPKQVGKHPVMGFAFRGGPIQQVGTKAWTVALRRAGFEYFHWHELRHTFAF
jgi:hypothetical protein